MEKIKFSIFDIFAYLLPGSIVLSAIVLLSTPNTVHIAEYIKMAKQISIGLGIILIFISYIMGNVTDNLGSWLYYKIGCKIWGSPYPDKRHPTLNHDQQRALIREYSPENFNTIQTWKVLKTMSHNLSFAMLLITITSITRFFQYQFAEWISVGAVSIISAVILLNRANIYDRWHYKQMLEIVSILKLEEKANSDSFDKLKGNSHSKTT